MVTRYATRNPALLGGELVVHHFFGLGHTNNGVGLICERTLAAGSWLDPKFAGERIPTLAEVFDLCKGKCRFEMRLLIRVKSEN